MFQNTLVFIYIWLALKGQRSNKQINEVLAMGEQPIAEHSDQLNATQRSQRTPRTWAGGVVNQFADVSIKSCEHPPKLASHLIPRDLTFAFVCSCLFTLQNSYYIFHFDDL